MNRIATTSIVLAMTGVMLGCAPRYADVPAPTRFENSTQYKLQAAEHWNRIAQHFALQMSGELRGQLNGRSIHVPTPGDEQPFVNGFRELLITALMAQGLPISNDARSPLVMDIRYSIHRFQPDRAKNTYYYGEATALTAGILALGGVLAADLSSTASVSAGVKGLAVASALDAFGWVSQEGLRNGRFAAGPVPRSEILLTASVTDAHRIVSRRSTIYYTEDEDRALYWERAQANQPPPSGHRISVHGDCGQGSSTCVR
ncbi:hypothetical protein [Zoogloea sp.]|uniref:hypothetical protein n=1 Tax=Zoogloea sp. TaxID=49181 RepID=UPI00262DC747|nr:hypothetical protein [Zoogloea sp.]MDD3353036.1 hypothetical protein [Zoogloea sp.]